VDPIINAVLKPKSIAVIGASTNPEKIGYKVVENLKNCGYQGAVYPINPDAEEIVGYKCYPSVKDVPYVVDAAVITVPAKIVPKVVLEAGEKGVKGLSIITSGFSEVGDHALEEEIVRIAHEYGMRIIGPNIIGVLSNSDKMNASFYNYLPYEGKAALVSQSGALLIAMAAATYTRRVGFDKMISIGNQADLDFADLIAYLNEDDNTTCITLYIEGIKDGPRFMEEARKCTKPIIALKAGSSAHGAAAAASHTGSLAGSAKVYEAAFEQAGVAQAEDLNDMFDTTLALSLQPTMKGDNLLIVTNGGGVGVLATDAAEKYGLPLNLLLRTFRKSSKNTCLPLVPPKIRLTSPVVLVLQAITKGSSTPTHTPGSMEWLCFIAKPPSPTHRKSPKPFTRPCRILVQVANLWLSHSSAANAAKKRRNG